MGTHSTHAARSTPHVACSTSPGAGIASAAHTCRAGSGIYSACSTGSYCGVRTACRSLLNWPYTLAPATDQLSHPPSALMIPLLYKMKLCKRDWGTGCLKVRLFICHFIRQSSQENCWTKYMQPPEKLLICH